MVAPQKLARNPFFAGLTAEDRELLSPIAESRTYAAGETIFPEGGATDILRILDSGLVSFRQRQRHGGDEVAVGHVGDPGAVFGISALVGNEHVYPHSAVCLEEAEVIEIDGRQILAICEAQPRAGVRILLALAAVMADRLTAAREQLRSRLRPGLISHG